MRILLIAPIHVRVALSDRGPGRDVALLARELIVRGHDVTIFSSQKPEGPWDYRCCHLPGKTALAAESLDRYYAVCALARASEFDVVHSFAGISVAARARELDSLPLLVSLPDSGGLAQRPRGWSAPYTSVSWAQAVAFAGGLPDRGFAGVVHPPVDVEALPFEPDKADFLLALGPVGPAWGTDLAIAVARKTESPLRIVGPVAPGQESFFQREVAPKIDGNLVRYQSALDSGAREKLMADARALLLVPRREPSWSRAAAEALAMGTPVVALDHPSAHELIAHAETGFIGMDLGDLCSAVSGIDLIRPVDCRRRAERLWDAGQVAAVYERIYRRVASGEAAAAIHPEFTALEL